MARRLFRGRFQASAAPWLGWLLPREAGLRRQSRHPCKANTERRSGRGTGVSGATPFGFCCPAAIKYPAGAVSSLPVESLAVVQPAATGGGGNGSGTERRLVLAAQTLMRRRRRMQRGVCGAAAQRPRADARGAACRKSMVPKGCPLWSVFGYFLLTKKVTSSALRFERNINRKKPCAAEISIPAVKANLGQREAPGSKGQDAVKSWQ